MFFDRIVTSWSIRKKLLLLILTVLLPAAGIIVLDGIKDRRQQSVNETIKRGWWYVHKLPNWSDRHSQLRFD